MTNEYVPDLWVIIKITPKQEYKDVAKEHYRVFAMWYGGYLSSDSWRMNSGIETVEDCEDHYKVFGSSGSCYCCSKNSYGFSSYGRGILTDMIQKSSRLIISVLPENSNLVDLFSPSC